MKTILAATAGSLLLCSAAMAQTTATPAQTTPPPKDAATLQQQVTNNLKQAGFSNVKVMPGSYMVQAVDKSGNPIAMLIGPNSVTELVNTAAETPTSQTAKGGNEFVALPGTDMVSSKVVGLDVHNSANQDIGTIKDLALNGGDLQAYILSVGGFLGMGDHYVAVSPSALHVTYDHAANSWHATLNTTEAQLKAAPSYTYPAHS